MSVLTVPLSDGMSGKIAQFVKDGVASSKADFARKAMDWYAEELAIQTVLKAQREVREGKVLYGDLDVLAETV